MSAPLPVAGVWSRQWEEDPLGDSRGADRDTLVLWTQSRDSGIYVDLRLPIDSPGRSLEAAQKAGIQARPSALAANGYSDVAKKQLVSNRFVGATLHQKSFAGVLEYKPGDTTSGEALTKDKILAQLATEGRKCAISLCTCFWHRDLDYQPPSGGLDIGVCASGAPHSDGSILLRETGVDASYAEGWLRLPGTEKGPFMALALVSENDNENARRGYWVRAGNRFAYAVGYPTSAVSAAALKCPEKCVKIKEYIGQPLADVARSLAPVAETILDIIGSYGALAGEIVDRNWKILCSTNPELVGCSLLGDITADKFCCSRLTGHAAGDVIQAIPTDGATLTRRWKVLELIGCSLPLDG